jgi:hypothetical protein
MERRMLRTYTRALRLASATNLGSPTAPGGSGQTQHPLQIRDTNVEVAANDMELEEQE